MNKYIIIILILILILSIILVLHLKKVSNYKYKKDRNPIIFVPGLGGTQLENSQTNWNAFPNCNFLQRAEGLLWASNNPFPGSTCFMDLVSNEYDNETNTLKTNKNIKINVKGKIGDVKSTSCLNNSFPNCLFGSGVYTKYFFESLNNIGYKNNIDLYSAGYDFRLVPFGNVFDYNTYSDENNHIGKYFLELMSTIENVFSINNNKKIILIGHSTGCKLICLFINIFRKFENEGIIENGWINKHIKNTVFKFFFFA